MEVGKKKRKYRTKAQRISRKKYTENQENDSSFNYTLNDSYWMDSFDKLVQKEKLPLREQNLLKKAVRVSFNRDSSFDESSIIDDKMILGQVSTPRLKLLPLLDVRPEKNMFFNYVSTPSNRKSDNSLNLDVIVSSEGESSVWKRISFPNVSDFMQKRRFESSPVAVLEKQKRLKENPKKLSIDPFDKAPKQSVQTKRVSVLKKGNMPTRKSEKKKQILFNITDEEEEKKVEPKEDRNCLILKPGKWRKSIANLRRTIQTVDEEKNEPAKPLRKQSTRKTLAKNYKPASVPEQAKDIRKSMNIGRHRKSIYIPPIVEKDFSSQEVGELL